MTVNLDQTTAVAAIGAAQFLKARTLASGHTGILAHGVSTKEIAETITELAGEFNGNIAAASAALWAMDESERLEAFGMEMDDERSYLAAKYGMAV